MNFSALEGDKYLCWEGPEVGSAWHWFVGGGAATEGFWRHPDAGTALCWYAADRWRGWTQSWAQRVSESTGNLSIQVRFRLESRVMKRLSGYNWLIHKQFFCWTKDTCVIRCINNSCKPQNVFVKGPICKLVELTSRTPRLSSRCWWSSKGNLPLMPSPLPMHVFAWRGPPHPSTCRRWCLRPTWWIKSNDELSNSCVLDWMILGNTWEHNLGGRNHKKDMSNWPTCSFDHCGRLSQHLKHLLGNRYNRLQKIETMLTGGEWSESVSSPRGVSQGQSNVSKEFWSFNFSFSCRPTSKGIWEDMCSKTCGKSWTKQPSRMRIQLRMVFTEWGTAHPAAERWSCSRLQQCVRHESNWQHSAVTMWHVARSHFLFSPRWP